MKLNDKGLPLYYQIEKYMREKILGNEWPVGTQIPTETELMSSSRSAGQRSGRPLAICAARDCWSASRGAAHS